ncbi:MAG TPA: hypothetical protein VLE74_01960 [Candidatus Saccharimonadales bacterium]|nr:hypothetical protein [Candidatus Saccharimonadales bacterium]
MRLRRKPSPAEPNVERRRPRSVSPTVFSYYARGNSPSSQNTGRRDEPAKPSVRRKRYRLRMAHLPSYLALAAIIIALLNVCWLQPNPKIILVSTAGTVHRSPKEYQQTILALWKQSLFNQTKLTVSTGSLRRDIQQQFTELQDVQIELPLLGRRPTVILTPAVPTLQLVSGNGSFYVDGSGKVMARTTELTQNELKDVPLVRDESGQSAEAGKIVIPGPEAAFLQKLFAQLQAQNIPVLSITLPANAANEADIRITNQQYFVKFSVDNDARQAVGTYLAAKAKLDAEHAAPSEYMDVRVPEKVFYK